jgi:hypothetical protein
VDTIQFGIDTFGDLPRDDRGEIVSYAEAIRRVVAEAVLADEIGIDVIAVGECRLTTWVGVGGRAVRHRFEVLATRH